MEIEIYGKQHCAKCKTTKNKLTHFISKWGLADQISVQFHDMDTPEGMAEGMFNDVSDALPTTIIRRDSESVARWDGEIPDTKDIRECVTAQAI